MARGRHLPNDKRDSDEPTNLDNSGMVRVPEDPLSKEACLVAISGPDPGRKFSLGSPSVTVGRSVTCDIQVDQGSASRAHSEIINDEQSFRIRDLGSTNGTYVNDELVKEERTLVDGDFVKIGRTTFKFLSGGNIERIYYEELYRLSTVDALTQTLNRGHLLKRLEQETGRSSLASPSASLVALKLSLSGAYGNEEADNALQALVRELNILVRPGDFLGRYSDNVLVLFLKRDSAQARAFCDQLVTRKTQNKDALLARSNVSLGLVKAPGGTGATLLLKDAIRRAEAAGRLGGDRIVDDTVPLPDGSNNNLQSTFISYGGPDLAFAKKLNEALKLRGVQTFLFEEDAVPGTRLHEVMHWGVNAHDRVILVCSKASLERRGLLNELEETLAREARDGGATYLLPVRLDNYVIDGWNPTKPGLAQRIRDRVIADFRDHDDPAAFGLALTKVMFALTKPEK
jgi:pSer/pThr/pTyr-binding forkhead associated (FHA) protein